MARTNKRGIAAKKAQLQKQASRMKGGRRFEYPKRKLSLEEAKDFGVVIPQTNPKGRVYHRFASGRKVCRETRLRIDPDGYRMIVTQKGSREMVEAPIGGWTRKQLMRKMNQSSA
jgi:hypothetical protein